MAAQKSGGAEFLKYRVIYINHAFWHFIEFINATMIVRALNKVSFKEMFGKWAYQKRRRGGGC